MMQSVDQKGKPWKHNKSERGTACFSFLPGSIPYQDIFISTSYSFSRSILF